MVDDLVFDDAFVFFVGAIMAGDNEYWSKEINRDLKIVSHDITYLGRLFALFFNPLVIFDSKT